MAEMRDFMTVGELAEQVGKTPRAIRLYEELGLLVPRGRTCGNYREYGPDAPIRLQWIARLHDLGLPLTEVKAFLDDVASAASAGEAMRAVRVRYTETLRSVDAQLERLRALRAGLESSLAWLESCQGCVKDLEVLQTDCQSCARHDGQPEPELVRGVKAQSTRSNAAPCGGNKESP